MKKEDFVRGKWYQNKHWKSTFAIKLKYTINNTLIVSELVKLDGNLIKITHDFSSWKITEDYREVSIEELSLYLPLDHPDLINYFPKYVQCLEVPPGWTITKKNIIYETKKDNNFTIRFENGGQMIDNHRKYFKGSTAQQYWDQLTSSKVTILDEFPVNGYCLEPRNQKLIDYLDNFHDFAGDLHHSDIGVCWNSKEYWFIQNTNFFEAIYKIEQLNKFINFKNNKNEKQEVLGITSTESRTTGSGTVIIRCGRQQSSIGSRPQGNKTSVSVCRTRINSIKIVKNIIK